MGQNDRTAVGMDAEESYALLGSFGAIRHGRVGSSSSGLVAVEVDQHGGAARVPASDLHYLEMSLAPTCWVRQDFDNVVLNPGRFRVHPGSLNFVSAGEGGSVECGPGRTFQLLIDRSVMDDAKRDLLPGDPDRAEMLSFNGLRDARLKWLMGAVHAELLRPEQGSALMADALAQALCIEIARGYTTATFRAPVREGRRPTLSEAQLGRALEAIEAAVEENPGLDALAEAVGLSPYHFSRAFKAATGWTPHAYLAQRRLIRARELLAGTMPLAEVALACGFSSQSHFTTAFRQRHGTTPGAYRRDVRR